MDPYLVRPSGIEHELHQGCAREAFQHAKSRAGLAPVLDYGLSLPIAGIAERCGYDTSNGLCLAFERNLGVTPWAYRKHFSSANGSLR